jgi:hypothetical protein
MAAYHHLETHGFANQDQGPFNLIFKTKMAAWNQFFLKGGMFKGMTGTTLAMANTMQVFLKYAKIRALTKKQ